MLLEMSFSLTSRACDGLEWAADSRLEENAARRNYYGLGDKAGPMNRRNRAFTNWNTDAFGWQESTDPLLQDHSVFSWGFAKAWPMACFSTTPTAAVSISEKSPRTIFSFGAEGGELNYYFIAGPEPKKIIEQYTRSRGALTLPPLWTLGYQQCRYSYYPEARVRRSPGFLARKGNSCDTISRTRASDSSCNGTVVTERPERRQGSAPRERGVLLDDFFRSGRHESNNSFSAFGAEGKIVRGLFFRNRNCCGRCCRKTGHRPRLCEAP